MHEIRLVDMHCHLDRMANASAVQYDAATHGIAIFDTTVTPNDYLAARTRFEYAENVRVGVGLHPWWIADGRATRNDAKHVADLLCTTSYVGEIGLDLSPRFQESYEMQREALDIILSGLENTLEQDSSRTFVLSLHAVRSVSPILDMLNAHRLLEDPRITCIFHWFSGTSDELYRVRTTGSLISVNEHSLTTKRGREYARIMPIKQLLLETDAPPGLDSAYAVEALETSLTNTAQMIAVLRKLPVGIITEQTTANATLLLGL